MEQDKINLKIPENWVNVLDQDCIQFGFLKKNFEPNRNNLLNRIITSYKNDSIGHNKLLNELFVNPNETKENVSFKPIKENALLVEKLRLENDNFSHYLKGMIFFYILLSQEKREQFLFSDVFAQASQAIQEKRKLMCVLRNQKRSILYLNPLTVGKSKQEQHTYIVSFEKDRLMPLKLSSVEKAVVLNETIPHMDNSIDDLLLRLKKNGPQYSYSSEDENIVVELDPYGWDYYKKMYMYRPIPDKVVGDKMIFSCSPDHFFNYFIRLGNVVKIISPESMKNRFKSFYQKSIDRLKRD